MGSSFSKETERSKSRIDMPVFAHLQTFEVTNLSIRKSLEANLREHLGVFVLASFSNVFLSVSK